MPKPSDRAEGFDARVPDEPDERGQLVTATRQVGATVLVSGSVRKCRRTRSVRTRKPPPVSISATPMTMANVATLSAKYEECSAVVSAVSVTQRLRAGLSTGLPLLGSTAAAFSLLVGWPFLPTYRGICAYVLPPVASRVCLRMTLANASALLPLLTSWLGMLESGVPTICSRARSLWTRSMPLAPTTIVPAPKATRITLAAIPPYWRSLLMVPFLSPDW